MFVFLPAALYVAQGFLVRS